MTSVTAQLMPPSRCCAWFACAAHSTRCAQQRHITAKKTLCVNERCARAGLQRCEELGKSTCVVARFQVLPWRCARDIF